MLLVNTEADDNAKRTWKNTSADMNETSIRRVNNNLSHDIRQRCYVDSCHVVQLCVPLSCCLGSLIDGARRSENMFECLFTDDEQGEAADHVIIP